MRNYFPSTTNGFLQVPIDKVPFNENCEDEMTLTLIGTQDVYKDKLLCLNTLNLNKKVVKG